MTCCASVPAVELFASVWQGATHAATERGTTPCDSDNRESLPVVDKQRWHPGIMVG